MNDIVFSISPAGLGGLLNYAIGWCIGLFLGYLRWGKGKRK